MSKKSKIQVLSFVLMLLMLFTVNGGYTSALSAERTIGNRITGVSATDRTVIVSPIASTNVYHQRGYSTTLGVAYTESRSYSPSASIAVTFKFPGADLAAGLGFATTVSYAVTTNMSFTIPATTSKGHYRISVGFPSYRLIKREWTTSWVLDPSATRSITSAPRAGFA